MNRPVIVLGAGGHAKVLLGALRAAGERILGVTDLDPSRVGQKVLGVEVIGDDRVVLGYRADEIHLVNGLGGTGSTDKRRSVYEAFADEGYSFATVTHPSAVIGLDVTLGEGAQVMAGVVIQPGSRIAANALVNTRASIDHDARIGEHAHIAPGATLSGGVRVGPGAHVGTGASVIQAVTLGRSCLVGAGSAVIEDVPDNATVVGVPAKVVKTR